MSDSEQIYEVRESGESPRFLTSTAMAMEYHKAYTAINEWGGTFLKIASAENRDRGIMVKTHPRSLVKDDEIETKEDVS